MIRSKYDAIVQLFPDDYEKTLQAVQDFLTDDQVCDVLVNPDCVIANNTMLNFLMEKVNSMVDVLEFCNQLEKITPLLTDPSALNETIIDLRSCENA